MGKGGEQQFGYQPNVYASQPQALFSGGQTVFLFLYVDAYTYRYTVAPHKACIDGAQHGLKSLPQHTFLWKKFRLQLITILALWKGRKNVVSSTFPFFCFFYKAAYCGFVIFYLFRAVIF